MPSGTKRLKRVPRRTARQFRALVRKITAKNQHRATAWGTACGKEVW